MADKEKKEKELLSADAWKFAITIRNVIETLGTAPADPTIYEDFIVSKALQGSFYKAVSAEEKALIKKAILDHELSLLPGIANAEALDGSPQSVRDVLTVGDEPTQKGRTIFRQNKSGLVMLDYQLKGFYKAAGKAVGSVYQPESRIDKFLFVSPREILWMRDGAPIPRPEGECQRPLRTEDARTGVARTCIAVSDTILPGATLTYEVVVLPKGFSGKSTGGQMSRELIRQFTEYGIFSGLGAWRNASHGAFEIVSFEELPISWSDAIDLRRHQLVNNGLDVASAVGA
jgi:hypothetical protein